MALGWGQLVTVRASVGVVASDGSNGIVVGSWGPQPLLGLVAIE